MSLLLDALKRAEQEKLAKQGERPANDAAAAPEIAPAKREPAKAGSLELQPLGAAQAASAVVPPAAPARAAGAATAQAVFQAKAAPPKPEGARNMTMLWVIIGVIVVAAIGIGGYVWWSLSALQPKITTLRPRSAPPGPAADAQPTGRAKADSLVPGANAPGTPTRGDVPMPPAAPTPPPASGAPLPTGAAPDTANVASNNASPSPPITTLPSRGARNADLAAQLVRDAPGAPSLKLAPAEKPRVPTEIAAGYDALRSGDLPAARRSYTAALATDPASLDAYLGLATIEARLGNVAVAASHYRRALDLDPRNATALAGLASIADLSQPEQLEGQLRADIARYPQSAALQFALGNLYASRGRWEDAQAAFFEALRLEPASADALYNLAIAMDHMGQQRLAADYYRRAFEAARSQPAQFDPAQVARRLSELRP